MKKRIEIRTIPKGEEHFCGYPTQGDWQTLFDSVGNPIVKITVSEMDDEDAEFAVAVHELIEMWLCKKAGVREAAVSAFDRTFEAEREKGIHSDEAEPGDDPRAPYRKQHQTATLIEMMVIEALGKSWPDHNENISV